MKKITNCRMFVRSALMSIVIGSFAAQAGAQDAPSYPDVKGKQLSAVEPLVEDLGIELRIDEIDAPGRKGRILEQIPPADTPLGETARMYVEVANGLVVPDVIRKNVDVVKAELEDQGFSVEISRRPMENVPEKLVVFVTPEVGTRIDPQNEAVFLIASSQHLVRLPADLLNASDPKNGNDFKIVKYRPDPYLDPYCPIKNVSVHYDFESYSHAPGSLVPIGSEVTIYYSVYVNNPC